MLNYRLVGKAETEGAETEDADRDAVSTGAETEGAEEGTEETEGREESEGTEVGTSVDTGIDVKDAVGKGTLGRALWFGFWMVNSGEALPESLIEPTTI